MEVHESANLIALMNYRVELSERLKRAIRNYKKTPKDRIKRPFLETKLKVLEEHWTAFNEVQKTLSMKHPETKGEEFDQAYDNFEELYVQFKSELSESLQYILSSSTSTAVTLPEVSEQNVETRLPTIQLPKFRGNYDEWPTFYDLFHSLIHTNQKLSRAQKLHYLKSNLTGEAELLLRNFATTDANYDDAWRQLVKRYNNKRFNCNAILRTLFTQKAAINESASSIKQLVDTTSSCLTTLKNLGINTDSWDAIINYLVVSKLDGDTMKQWEQHLSISMTDELPTWMQLNEFLELRFRSLEMIDSNRTRLTQPRPVVKPKAFHSEVKNDVKVSCAMCNDSHFIYHCKSFGELTAKERQEFVQKNRLCFNCLSPSHSVMKCRQSACCRRCGRRHHSLLHFERESNVETGKPAIIDTQIVTNFSSEMCPSNVLLATAIVNTYSKNGSMYVMRALLDQGSQASYVTEAMVQALNLSRKPVSGWVSGVGEGQTRIKHMVSLIVESRHNPKISVKINAFVLRSLTSLLPSTKLCSFNWLDIHNLELADPDYTTPGKIDVLLGAEIYGEILRDGIIKHPDGKLLAQNTVLGWILSGRTPGDAENFPIVSMHVQYKEDELLKQFWEIENEPNNLKKINTKLEEKCEQFYHSTTKRDSEGRFIVKLPFNSVDPECQYGNTKEIAYKRFEILEKRLVKNPVLRNDYEKVMTEYIEMNHMTLIEPNNIENSKAVYLPHHAVVREDKDTTKVRVVFDASCKGTNNVSLNDNLIVGPKLQQDLRHIIMRWRYHKICITADIIKMYRMVRVADEDTDFQRLIWRANPEEPMKEYRLLRLTFGTACAPYLAVKTLQRLAEEERENYPVASEITVNDFYMDDLLTGCETLAEATNIFKEMNKLLISGGFELQKWSSNNEDLLKHIGDTKRDDHELPLKINDLVKVLGLSWNRVRDTFEFKINLPDMKKPVTKRQILSEIAKLYDPLGWLGPVVVVAKLIMQKLWKAALEWDETITDNLLDEWTNYRDGLSDIQNICVPRWFHTTRESKVELHVFADASKLAYGAAVYMRVINKDHVHVSLVSAKTKVAPIEKEISIPRLELCGAVLAAKLIYEVAQVMNISTDDLYAWTDSTIVLAWLRSGPSRWTTFVSNRVSDILNILEFDHWRHVTTETNPADCASRGLQPRELINHPLWWHGPEWLNTSQIISKENDNIQNDTHEEEKTICLTVVSQDTSIFERFSSLSKMIRVLSYCRRILNMKLPKLERKVFTKFITNNEMEDTLQCCIKQIQCIEFSEEIKQVANHGCVPKKSKLRTLCPILDKNGILRVGGRIQQSHVSYDTQHPIILSTNNHISKLIILDAHQQTLHGGPQVTLNYIRTKYWILRGKSKIKQIYRACVICRRYSKNTTTQLMGQLPQVRLTPSKPFKSTGVDYAGPINIKFSPGRGAKSYKGYICLFVCMVTRAIHLEAVSDLTAKGFMAAFRRFTARRGHCRDIYSDNGTNFVGADKLLRDMLNSAKSSVPSEIAEQLSLERCTWHYIPPHSPNYGALWESGVRCTKSMLRKIMKDTTLTYEELTTVLTQIEACLNSRPISVLSDDPNDPLPLTPGHFLVGEPLLNLADENYNNVKVMGLERWRLVQKMVTDFWNRWSKEYIVSLNHRYKWNSQKPEPEIGDVVLLKEDNVPPSRWLLGIIIDKHVGPDNLSRVFLIKCKNGTFKRSLNKITVLMKENHCTK